MLFRCSTRTLPRTLLQRRAPARARQVFIAPRALSFHSQHPLQARRNAALENIENMMAEEQRKTMAKKIQPESGNASSNNNNENNNEQKKNNRNININQKDMAGMNLDADELKKLGMEGGVTDAMMKALRGGNTNNLTPEEISRLERVLGRAQATEPKGEPKQTFTAVVALVFVLTVVVVLSWQRDHMEAEFYKDILSETAEQLNNEILLLRDQKKCTEQHVEELLQAQRRERKPNMHNVAHDVKQWFKKMKEEETIDVYRKYDGGQDKYFNAFVSDREDKVAWSQNLARATQFQNIDSSVNVQEHEEQQKVAPASETSSQVGMI